jgi:hypothetical protein
MGTKWKMVTSKTNEWATWQWVNVKVDKKNISILKQTINISKEDMEDYNLVMFTHVMDFFREHASLKKPISERFFTSLLNDLSIRDLVRLGNLLSIEFMKPRQQLYSC